MMCDLSSHQVSHSNNWHGELAGWAIIRRAGKGDQNIPGKWNWHHSGAGLHEMTLLVSIGGWEPGLHKTRLLASFMGLIMQNRVSGIVWT